MKNLPANLPIPTADALLHSQALIQLIRAEITANGGYISFARFMELALYAPGLGYYSAGCWKFGQKGDFVTAPEISPLFAQCLARQCQQVLLAVTNGEIIELGAGTGKLAVDLLLELEKLNCLPQRYSILEVSAELRLRQQAFCREKIPHLMERMVWLDQLPGKPIQGIILANEVLDAMPVQRFHLLQDELQEFYVGWQGDDFVWHLAKPQHEIKLGFTAETPYEFENNLNLTPWMASVSECLQQGLVLLIDYGFPQHEYYHPDRSMGTLMCHYQHHSHADPFLLVGLQDITAHVDFTAVAETAVENNLQVAGFTTQAAFLLNCGLLDLLNQADEDSSARLALNQQINLLTSPAEMGELFKVIALTRELDEVDLLGFQQFDQRMRL
jgi:SAM-dependent MidA family methyltransferase